MSTFCLPSYACGENFSIALKLEHSIKLSFSFTIIVVTTWSMRFFFVSPPLCLRHLFFLVKVPVVMVVKVLDQSGGN